MPIRITSNSINAQHIFPSHADNKIANKPLLPDKILGVIFI